MELVHPDIMRRTSLAIVVACTGWAVGPSAASGQPTEVPFVVIETDILVARPVDAQSTRNALNGILQAYLQTEEPVPDVLSVWTTHPMFGSNIGTRYAPIANEVQGIGMETIFDTPNGDGLRQSPLPPLKGLMLHNNFTALDEAADRHEAPVDGYARYLFLLELSHVWGPAAQVPGPEPGLLLGFPFHWSFFMDAGASPAGGGVWEDLGDGRHRAQRLDPKTLVFSWLDLYLMGLARADEVAPFSVLTDVEVPEDVGYPIWGGTPIAGRTFPWFSDTELIVRAQRRWFTIDDIIEANGPRLPSAADAQTEFTVATVLVVRDGTAPATRERLARQFLPLAEGLAPAFQEATRGRGRLVQVASAEVELPSPDAGAVADAGLALDGGFGDTEDPPTADLGEGLDGSLIGTTDQGPPADGGTAARSRPGPSGCSSAAGGLSPLAWTGGAWIVWRTGRRRRRAP